MVLGRRIFFLIQRGGGALAANGSTTVVAPTFRIKSGTLGSRGQDGNLSCWRNASTTASTRSGAILPEPKTTPFGFFGVICGVVIGLFIGAAISKNVANFLEENDLFVPSDDDDDDD